LASLTIALAIYLCLEAILEFILGFALRPLPGWIIGTLMGISMLFGGTSRLAISLAARSVASKLV